MRLISEHIELNQYLFKYQMKCPQTKQIPTSPNCHFCDTLESVKHFLLKCNKYKFQRQSLFQKLIKINHKFKYNKFKSIKYLLFSYLLHNNGISKQILIWKEILNYTKETNRFQNIFQIDTNQL